MTSETKNTSSEILEIDPNGDVILSVPSSTQRVKVSSKVLCLASPVFRVMLEPSSKFLEGKSLQAAAGGSLIQLKLDDYDYDALLVIMNTMHLRTRQIPTTITVDQFYEIAVVCDKYDLAVILVPWVKIWTESFSNVAKKPGYERWLLISWVFRHSKIFSDITKELIMDTKLNMDDSLVTNSYNDIEDGIIPERVTEKIRQERERTIQSLVSLSTDEMEKYKLGALDGKNVCKATMGGYRGKALIKKRDQCDSIAFGSLLRCLISAKIMPGEDGGESQTAARVVNALGSMGDFGAEISVNDGMHHNCGPKKRLYSKVECVLGEVKGLRLLDLYPKGSIFFPDEI